MMLHESSRLSNSTNNRPNSCSRDTSSKIKKSSRECRQDRRAAVVRAKAFRPPRRVYYWATRGAPQLVRSNFRLISRADDHRIAGHVLAQHYIKGGSQLQGYSCIRSIPEGYTFFAGMN